MTMTENLAYVPKAMREDVILSPIQHLWCQRLDDISRCCDVLEEVRHTRKWAKEYNITCDALGIMKACEIGELDQVEELHRLLYELL